jgi:RNA-splicing ligase RtcB
MPNEKDQEFREVDKNFFHDFSVHHFTSEKQMERVLNFLHTSILADRKIQKERVIETLEHVTEQINIEGTFCVRPEVLECYKKIIQNIANLPFAFSHIAVMPDSHQGYGMPIGGVVATKDVIIPKAVMPDSHQGYGMPIGGVLATKEICVGTVKKN